MKQCWEMAWNNNKFPIDRSQNCTRRISDRMDCQLRPEKDVQKFLSLTINKYAFKLTQTNLTRIIKIKDLI